MKKIFHFILFVLQFVFYYILYIPAKIFYGSKRVWIICERGDDARDNGYWFYKHLNSEHKYVNNYYLIKKSSVDYQKIRKIGKTVRYKSFKHWLLYCAAEVRASTHLSSFAPGNFIGEWFKYHKQKGINVFLQHGITHNDFPSNYFEKNGSDLIICGAKPEFDSFIKLNHFPKSNVVLSGFSRFDGLHDFEVKKQILVMPSWRSYLFGLSKECFSESNYFKHWSSILSNNELLDYCKAKDISIVFYPHYSMQSYIELFKPLQNSVVKIADFDNFDVQELLKESSLLVTDYSSILFDFAYMKKPEILYQFDEDEFYGKHYQRGYFDHRKDGFGEVLTNEEDVISTIKQFDCDFLIKPKYCDRINRFFTINDTCNSERIYQAIIKKFIEKKKHHMSVNQLNVVVNGDDYGRNEQCTKGILLAFEKGYIQSASVIVNKDPKDKMLIEKLDKSKMKLHLNLTEGYACFGDSTNYAYSVNEPESISYSVFKTKKSYFCMSKKASEIVALETKGQIDRYKSYGFTNMVFDGHGHIQFKLPIAKIIIPIFKKEGFVETRIPSNLTKTFCFKKIYKKIVTAKYKKSFNAPSYFGSCDDFIHIKNYKKFKNKKIEIMTHPFVDENGNLVNRRDIDFDLLYYSREK